MVCEYIFFDDLCTDYSYFMQRYVKGTKPYSGWKYTIVGDNVNDLEFLYDTLNDFLTSINIPFKFGTTKLIGCDQGEQMFKLLTIYIMEDSNSELLLQDLKELLKDYNPKCTLKNSTHISGAIYKRVDIDEYGNYVPA